MASFDQTMRETIITAMANAMWEDALHNMAEEVGIDHNTFVGEHEEDVPHTVTDDARQWLAEIEGFNSTSTDACGRVIPRPIADIARELGADVSDDELEQFGYYCAMQYMGHGVAWSDSREGELRTPYGESSYAAMDAAYELLSDTDKKWHDVKELSSWSAVHEATTHGYMMRKLTSRPQGGLDEEIITPKEAEICIYTHAADGTDCPLIMIADFR